MFLSVEISYTPLEGEFKKPVREVIQRLQKSGLDVHPGPMSTQLFGPYKEVMKVVDETLEWSFEHHGKGVFNASFYLGDRRSGD
ncbi:MAG: hypothetical protein EA349_08935 [Halomonadaceae bacterium]|nr:MAG: hypothetical protein EA349_08935 [Halomonadaceae bacterium]